MSKDRPLTDLERRVLALIEATKYGTVHVVIQDAKVVQIEHTEKIRVSNGKPNAA